jgi:hypothetical protein
LGSTDDEDGEEKRGSSKKMHENGEQTTTHPVKGIWAYLNMHYIDVWAAILSTTCPEGMAQTNRREFPPEPPK